MRMLSVFPEFVCAKRIEMQIDVSLSNRLHSRRYSMDYDCSLRVTNDLFTFFHEDNADLRDVIINEERKKATCIHSSLTRIKAFFRYTLKAIVLRVDW